MSVVGEQEGIAVVLLGCCDDLQVNKEWIDEYWEGDPPSFQIDEVHSGEQDSTFTVITSTGNRFKVTVEPEQK